MTYLPKKTTIITSIAILASIMLAPAAAMAGMPATAWTGSSYGVIEVQQSNTHFEIVFNRLDGAGARQAAPVSVLASDIPIRFPTIHWTGLTFLIFWTQKDGDGTLIAARRLDPAGTPAGPIIQIHRSDYALTSFSSIAVEQNPHHFALSWEEKISPKHFRSMFLRVDTAGAKLTEPRVVSESNQEAPQPVTIVQLPMFQLISQRIPSGPAAGGPRYPSPSLGTAQSITSRPGDIAYAYPPPSTTPVVFPQPVRTVFVQPLPLAYYPFSPMPTFTQPVESMSSVQIYTVPAYSWSTSGVINTTPTTFGIATIQTGDLIRGSSPSVWRIGEDGQRHLFPDDFTFKSWSNRYEWVVTLPDDQIARIPLGKPMLIYPGFAIVKFTNDASLYTVSRIDVLRKMQGDTEARTRYGVNWKNRIHVYPSELKAQYEFEATPVAKARTRKIARASKPVAKKTTPAVQLKNLRARRVL